MHETSGMSDFINIWNICWDGRPIVDATYNSIFVEEFEEKTAAVWIDAEKEFFMPKGVEAAFDSFSSSWLSDSSYLSHVSIEGQAAVGVAGAKDVFFHQCCASNNGHFENSHSWNALHKTSKQELVLQLHSKYNSYRLVARVRRIQSLIPSVRFRLEWI